MKRSISILTALSIFLSFFSCNMAAYPSPLLVDQISVVGSYEDSTLNLRQPDSGFSEPREIFPSPEQVSTINPSVYTFLMINLKGYSGRTRADGQDKPLDDNFYESVRTTLQNARNNEVMVGIRFRFDEMGYTEREPDWANMVEMFEDIGESGILEEYKDIIVWCEMGTLGAFGEQWGTRYGDYGYTDELIDLYLSVLPEGCPLLLRTIKPINHWVNTKLGTSFTQNNCGDMVDIVKRDYGSVRNTVSNYYSGDGKNYATGNLISEDLGRLGIYNDGYMGTQGDYGTFQNREEETSFLNDQTDVVYGGEFSGDRVLQIYWDSQYTDVWYPMNAIPEMYYTNLAYLHGPPWYEEDKTAYFRSQSEAQIFVERLYTVYDRVDRESLIGTATISSLSQMDSDGNTHKVSYRAPGYDTIAFTTEMETAIEQKIGTQLNLSEYCGKIDTRTFIMQHIGYRYILRESKMNNVLASGDNLSFNLKIENTGFHKINMEKEVELLLVQDSKVISATLPNVDASTWDTGMTTLQGSIPMPQTISGGNWKVYLRISPPNKEAKDDAAYGTEFANPNIYNEELGANLIGQIYVDAPVDEGDSFTDGRPAGVYYTENVGVAADTAYLDFLNEPYTFTQDGKWGYTIMFRVDGIREGSEINLTKWSSTGKSSVEWNDSIGQLHSFNWFFQNNPTYGYGLTIPGNGYYLLYCPFYSVGPSQNASRKNDTHISTFIVNDISTPRADKDTPTSLNGNQATITPLGILEGAPLYYDITFHDTTAVKKSGTYDFQDTERATANNVQLKGATNIADLHTEVPRSKKVGDITYQFMGWTLCEGFEKGLVDEDQIALGTMDLYSYFKVDLSKTELNNITYCLTNGIDENGILYTLDPTTRTASVGGDSIWDNTSGFRGTNGDMCIIPGKVIQDGVTYTVTGVGSRAFESCTDLSSVYIPSSVNTIANDAFSGIENTVTIHTYEESAAATYAAIKGIHAEMVTAPVSTPQKVHYTAELTSLGNDGANVSITKDSGGESTDVLLVVHYGTEKRFLTFGHIIVDMEAGESKTVYVPYEKPLDEIVETKVFVWNSFGGMEPLTE